MSTHRLLCSNPAYGFPLAFTCSIYKRVIPICGCGCAAAPNVTHLHHEAIPLSSVRSVRSVRCLIFIFQHDPHSEGTSNSRTRDPPSLNCVTTNRSCSDLGIFISFGLIELFALTHIKYVIVQLCTLPAKLNIPHIIST